MSGPFASDLKRQVMQLRAERDALRARAEAAEARADAASRELSAVVVVSALLPDEEFAGPVETAALDAMVRQMKRTNAAERERDELRAEVERLRRFLPPLTPKQWLEEASGIGTHEQRKAARILLRMYEERRTATPKLAGEE